MTRSEMKEYIKEKTMSKRTIHRHLDHLVENGLLEHSGYNYRLKDKAKNNLKYWSHEFGDSILEALMCHYFPHTHKFEQNIEELVKIFGIYTLHCLSKAAQPSAAEDNISKLDLLNSDKLIVSWINSVFNPQRMLEYFVTVMNDLQYNDKTRRIGDSTLDKGRDKYSSQINTDKKTNSTKDYEHENGVKNRYYSDNAYNIYCKRFLATTRLLMSGDLSFYDRAKKSRYVLSNMNTVQKIEEILKRKYKYYYSAIIQMTRNVDIFEMTNSNEIKMAEWFSLLTSATDKSNIDFEI